MCDYFCMVIEILYNTESVFCKTLSMDVENTWMVVFVLGFMLNWKAFCGNNTDLFHN